MIVLGKQKEGIKIMAILTDEMLLESYHLAVELKLERDFIALLLAEIHKRELMPDQLEVIH